MLSSNYHTHSRYCDGSSAPEDYVLKALELGYSELGFSSHAPCLNPDCSIMKLDLLEEYLSEIEDLKTRYRDRISILTGMEIDHISGHRNHDWFHSPRLDYTLGSVHFLYHRDTDYFISIDTNPGQFRTDMDRLYGGDIKKLVRDYYRSVIELVTNFSPDILGHLDIVKKFNKSGGYFDENESWYRNAVMETLEAIKPSSTVVEVNTRGYYRGWTSEFYPSNWIIEQCSRFSIPMIINVDAHEPGHLKEGVDCIQDILGNDPARHGFRKFLNTRGS